MARRREVACKILDIGYGSIGLSDMPHLVRIGRDERLRKEDLRGSACQVFYQRGLFHSKSGFGAYKLNAKLASCTRDFNKRCSNSKFSRSAMSHRLETPGSLRKQPGLARTKLPPVFIQRKPHSAP
jgi:hypothetical protein